MAYSFTLGLQDLVSSKIMKLSQSINGFSQKVESAQQKAQGSFDKTTQSIGGLQGKLERLNQQRSGATSIRDITELNTKIRGTQGELKKLENLPPPSFGERLRGLGGQFSNLIGLAGGLALAMAAWNGIKAVFNKGVEFEQMQIKFNVLLGSVEEGQKMFNQLNEYSNATPYSNEAITKNAETMLAFGLSSEKTMSSIKMLGDVSMGNSAKLSGISLAYSQIMSTGRLMGQDLNQLINQGFNPLQVISENTGVSMADLKKKMEQGAISAEMVEEAFRLATSEGGKFNGMAEQMKETAGGKLSTLMGSLSFVVGKVGSKFATWLKPMINIGIAAVDKILPFARAIRDVFIWITECTPLLILLGGIVTAIAVKFVIANYVLWGYAIALNAMSAATWVATIAKKAFDAAMNLGAIGWIIIGITALIAIVTYLWKKFDWFRGGIMGVWEVLKGFGTMIKEYVIDRFKELLRGITGIGGALVAFFKGDWKKAWEIGKQAGKDLIGVDSQAAAIKKAGELGKSVGATFIKGYDRGVKMTGQPEAVKKTGELPEIVITPKQKPSDLFAALMEDTKEDTKDGEDDPDKKGAKSSVSKNADSVISGGRKTTNITVNIAKLQDDTKIYVSNAKEGISQLGESAQEALLRAVNSINQMAV